MTDWSIQSRTLEILAIETQDSHLRYIIFSFNNHEVII